MHNDTHIITEFRNHLLYYLGNCETPILQTELCSLALREQTFAYRRHLAAVFWQLMYRCGKLERKRVCACSAKVHNDTCYIMRFTITYYIIFRIQVSKALTEVTCRQFDNQHFRTGLLTPESYITLIVSCRFFFLNRFCKM